MPLVVHDEEAAGPHNVTNATDGQGGAKPARRFLTRVTATGRKKQEASLVIAIRVMELDLDPENIKVHETLLQQMLGLLEDEHNEFIMKESLDVNTEPQKSYMSEFEGKINRALLRHKTRLQLLPVPNQPPDREPQKETNAFRLMEEEMN
jgi:hypothetical protein